MVKAIRKLSLIQKIMIGIVIGTTLGFLVPEWTFISVLGELFVGALKAIAPILVFVLIIASLAQQKAGAKTYVGSILVVYLLATFLAAVVAVTASYLFPVKIVLEAAQEAQAAPTQLSDVLSNVLTSVVQNPIQAMIEGNYLSVLFWSSLIGIGLRQSSVATKDDYHGRSNDYRHCANWNSRFGVSFGGNNRHCRVSQVWSVTIIVNWYDGRGCFSRLSSDCFLEYSAKSVSVSLFCIKGKCDSRILYTQFCGQYSH